MTYYQSGSPPSALSADELKQGTIVAPKKINEKQKVLIVSPDDPRPT